MMKSLVLVFSFLTAIGFNSAYPLTDLIYQNEFEYITSGTLEDFDYMFSSSTYGTGIEMNSIFGYLPTFEYYPGSYRSYIVNARNTNIEPDKYFFKVCALGNLYNEYQQNNLTLQDISSGWYVLFPDDYDYRDYFEPTSFRAVVNVYAESQSGDICLSTEYLTIANHINYPLNAYNLNAGLLGQTTNEDFDYHSGDLLSSFDYVSYNFTLLYQHLDGDNGNYQTGYDNGYADGEAAGYQQGALLNLGDFRTLLFTIADLPLYMVRHIFDVQFLGFGIASIIFGILSVFLIIWLLRKFNVL